MAPGPPGAQMPKALRKDAGNAEDSAAPAALALVTIKLR